jgi:glycosyltransferase involved in cell wall biosynthesis
MQRTLDIVCLPDMSWDHVLWNNRQHVMYRLPRADRAVRVLYVSPPRFALSGTLTRRARIVRPRLEEEQVPDGPFTTRIGDRLWVIQPPLPGPNRLLRRRTPKLLDAWTRALVVAAMRRLRFASPLLWSYTPLAAPLVGRMGERAVCYDVVDDYPTVPQYASLGEHVRSWDRWLTEHADVVFTASPTLHEQRSTLSRRCHFVGNATNVELFARVQSTEFARPNDMAGVHGPVIGFHGAVASYRLDLGLICELSRRRPEWSFVLIGPVEDQEAVERLAGVPNVHLLGARPQDELPAYLAHFDAGLLPYRRTKYIEGSSSLKLYEFLAAGLPVVAPALPCFDASSGMIALCDGVDALVDALERALAEPARSAAAERLEFALAHSWERKIERMLPIVKALDGRDDPSAVQFSSSR